ncbi:MAG TPA: DegQ family serine endoprotease [Xanthobacteraceae bacterium]|nr:DegQ family serine endoprotease [Xanthobacteraceae bacterium]
MHHKLRAALLAFTLLATGLTAGAAAEERKVPTSSAEIRLSFAPAVRRAAPAVVNVYAAKIERVNPFFDDPLFRRFFGNEFERNQVRRSLGSGVIVDPSGFVVTNNHVIEGADEIKVALADKREFEAELVLKDTHTDLAVLRIKDGRAGFPAIELGNSDELEVGDLVLAIGNPFGVGQTVTHGIISALARTQIGVADYKSFIQTDAAINPGNSGGALVDMTGRLVGINTAIYSRTGGSQGIGFAIPSNMVRVVVASAKGGGTTVRRPWLGARLQAVTPEIAEGLGLSRPMGALVSGVAENSPAARAGLAVGDLIVAFDGHPVEDVEAFGFRFATKAIGGRSELGVRRNGKALALSVPLEAAPEMPPRDPVKLRGRSPFAGATVINISPAVAEELRIDPNARGVVVATIDEGTAAQMIGLRPGDIVLEVNGERVARSRDLARLTREPQRVWRLQISRGGKTITTVIGG